MTPRVAALLAALLPAAALAQTAGDGGVIQMQPLTALKPGADPSGTQPAQPAPQPPADPGTTATAPIIVPGQTTTTTTTADVAEAPSGTIRWLDKVSGDTVDLTLKRGQTETQGRLSITLDDCRYPVGDPNSNAYAFLTIRDSMVSGPIFKGWMVAASPALNPLDSARYDVWVLRCTTS